MLKFFMLCLVIACMPIIADAQGKGGPVKPGQDTAQDYPDYLFTPQDKQIILEYFGLLKKDDTRHLKSEDKPMPPGLAKRDQLPPGLQKYFQNHGVLPPGLAKRELPQDLERRLSTLKSGYERVIVDKDVLLIETATQAIIDILINVADE